MGDRITFRMECPSCGEVDEECYYAPTCGFTTWKCPKCKKEIDLEKYTGISAESCANTKEGLDYIKRLKRDLF